MLREIKRQFKGSSGPVTLEVVKEAQIYDWFLTNRSTHRLASYPVISDPTCVLPVGMKLTVISIRPRNGIVVSNPSGKTFDIFAADLKRHVKIV
jgi:hypothetical protein